MSGLRPKRAARARQFIAGGVDGGWGGTVTVLLEEAGAVDWAGASVERRQGHLVAVFVRPELRGRGLAEALIEAAVEWAWRRGAERVRLMVHEGNPRAQGFYRKVGFVPSGVTVPLSGPEGELERELELEFVLERS
ncbi:GNAT family N-acetyltransferase [Streptomyces sp. NPDC002643]